jgi:hypothetical protein
VRWALLLTTVEWEMSGALIAVVFGNQTRVTVEESDIYIVAFNLVLCSCSDFVLENAFHPCCLNLKGLSQSTLFDPVQHTPIPSLSRISQLWTRTLQDLAAGGSHNALETRAKWKTSRKVRFLPYLCHCLLSIRRRFILILLSCDQRISYPPSSSMPRETTSRLATRVAVLFSLSATNRYVASRLQFFCDHIFLVVPPF